MAQYRSRATSSGFKGYTLPDTARNFEEAETKRIQQLKDAYATKRQSDEIINQTQRTQQQAVINQLNSNATLEESYKQAYKTSMQQRFETETRDLERQQKARNSVTDRLTAFSQTLLKEAGTELKRRKESEQAFGRNLVYQFGVDPEDLKALNTIEGNLQAESSANEAVVRKLKNNGATPDQINAIRNLDGWRLYGAEIEMATQGKSTYSSYLASDEVRNKTVKLGDGRELTLNQAAENMETDAYNSIKTILRNEFIENNFSTLNQSFADKYLYSGMRQVDETDFTQYQTNNRARLKEIETIEYTDQVGKIESTGISPQQFIINQNGSDKGPGLKLQRDKLLTEIEKQAGADFFDRNNLEKLLGSPWIQDGKTKTFAEQFANNPTVQSQLQAIRSKINDNESASAEAAKKALRLKNENLQNQTIDKWEVINTEQKSKIYKQLIIDGIEINPYLQKLFNGEIITPKVAQQEATDALLFGTNLKPEVLEVLGKTENVFANEIFSSSGQLSGTYNIDKTSTLLANEFLGVSSSSTDLNVANNTVVSEAAMEIKKDFQQRLLLNLKTQPTPEEAYRVTQLELTQAMRKGGRYEVLAELDPDNPREKTRIFRFQSQVDDGILRNEFIGSSYDAVKANPQYLVGKTIPTLTPQNKKVLIDSINATRIGRAPQWVRDQFKRAQKSSNGQPGFVGNLRDYLNQIQKVQLLDVDPLSDENMFFDMPANPEINRLMESYNTVQPTNLRATQIATTAAGAKGIQQYRPALDLIASVESSNDTLYNGYDALNKGGNGSYVVGTNTGTSVFDQSLTTMTVGEIRNLQRQGLLFAAGRYQFLETTLTDIFDRGLAPGIDDSTLFDQDTQDRLGIAYIKDTISTYRDMNGDVVDGMGQRFVGLQKVPREKIKAALDTFQSAVVGTPFENIDVIPEVAEQLERSGTGALTFAGNKMRYQKAGKAFQGAGFTVREQSLFDKVDPVHSGNSHHNYDEAFDITHQEGDDVALSIAKTKRLKEVVRGLNLFKEVIGPGDYEAGLWKDRSHDEHLHLGGLLRPITQEDIDAINSVK